MLLIQNRMIQAGMVKTRRSRHSSKNLKQEGNSSTSGRYGVRADDGVAVDGSMSWVRNREVVSFLGKKFMLSCETRRIRRRIWKRI